MSMNEQNDIHSMKIDGTPFSVLMNQAASLKTAQLARDRKFFDSYPKFIQNTLYHGHGSREDEKLVINARNIGIQLKNRFSVAEYLKNEGNKQYDDGNFVLAYSKFELAASVFRYLESTDHEWKSKGIIDKDIKDVHFYDDTTLQGESIKKFLCKCYLNISLTTYKLDDYKQSKLACDEVLRMDPSNSKAYYRRAKARLAPVHAGALEQEEALHDLSVAMKLNSSSCEVRRYYLTLRDQIKDQRKRDKLSFGGIFKRSSKSLYFDTEQELSASERRDQKDEMIRRAEFLVEHYRNSGNEKDEKELRIWLDKVKDSRMKKIEKNNIDFRKPTTSMIKKAKELSIDLKHPLVLKELDNVMKGNKCNVKTNNENQEEGRCKQKNKIETDIAPNFKPKKNAMFLMNGVIMCLKVGLILVVLFRFLSILDIMMRNYTSAS